MNWFLSGGHTAKIRVGGGSQFISGSPGPSIHKIYELVPLRRTYGKYAFHPANYEFGGSIHKCSPRASIHKIYELGAPRRTYGKIRLLSGKIRLSSGQIRLRLFPNPAKPMNWLPGGIFAPQPIESMNCRLCEFAYARIS